MDLILPWSEVRQNDVVLVSGKLERIRSVERKEAMTGERSDAERVKDALPKAVVMELDRKRGEVYITVERWPDLLTAVRRIS